MEAKDTVISGVEEVNGTTFLPSDYISWREHHNLMEKQAEISFEAGREYEHKIMISCAVDEGNKAFKDGRRNVVEWVREHQVFELMSYNFQCILKPKWKAKLKEWNISA